MENFPDSCIRFAFETASAGAFGRPPPWPRVRAADSPSFVRSTIMSLSSSAIEAITRKKNRPIDVVVSMESLSEMKSTPVSLNFSAPRGF